MDRVEVRPLSPSDPLSDPALRRELVDRYLVWDAYVAGARRVELHPLVLPRALHLSAGFILEEGLPMDLLWRIVCSMRAARARRVRGREVGSVGI